ncbi:hypothetical protein EVAR_90171_1 [Eumeta japonica]|uniref:Uncharacterized protein n=1 Tax=Eumeta variegata TaxID=151549 RepID=A0A4C1WW81_EUMVA|nr:hypothetical protein EVAR_90171_1 [Eumeta japonica]
METVQRMVCLFAPARLHSFPHPLDRERHGIGLGLKGPGGVMTLRAPQKPSIRVDQIHNFEVGRKPAGRCGGPGRQTPPRLYDQSDTGCHEGREYTAVTLVCDERLEVSGLADKARSWPARPTVANDRALDDIL